MNIDQMIQQNMKLVYQVINDLAFIPEGVEVEDLEAIGAGSLWKAIESYSEGAEYQLSTHCYRNIRGDIIQHLRKSMAQKRQERIVAEDTYLTSFEEEVVGSMLVDEVRNILNDREYNFLNSKVIQGRTIKEIAFENSLKVHQVRWVIDSAKKKLRNNLKWEAN